MRARLITIFSLLLAPWEAEATAVRAPVAVIGSTGRLGRLAVQQLVERGYPVRILLRHDLAASPSSEADAEPAAVAAWLATMPGVLPVKGDVTNRESVDELLRGCSACLALHGARRSRKLSDLWSDPTTDPKHSKNVNYEGVRNLIEAAQASETCRRLVRITGKGETPWSIFSILINGLGSMAKAWNYEGEQLLRACKDIDYTIIRPGVMGRVDDVPADSLALADNGGDLKVSSIAHGAIASLCVECLDHPNAARTTLTAMSVPPGEGASSWEALLQKVKPDSRAFRADLLAEHLLAMRVGGTAIIAAMALFAAGVLNVLKMLVLALVGLVR